MAVTDTDRMFAELLEQEDVLRLVTGRGPDAEADTGEEVAELEIDGTSAGRSFTGLAPLEDGPGRWWTPLLNGAERLGVLRVDADGSAEQTTVLQRLASLVCVVDHLGA